MKKILIIPFLLISLICSATNYYVKTGGNDGLSGTSIANAWASITKVNSYMASYANGDSVLFHRGDTFVGTINATWSTNALIIGAYGTGADPIITGFTTITGWTNLGLGIYTKTIAATGLNMVTVDGVNTAMGRYPNTGWFTYESHSGTTSITDSQIGSSFIGLLSVVGGYEVVIRKHTSAWMLDRNVISSCVDNTLTFTSGSDWEPFDGLGYFVQNNNSTYVLDVLGEWAYKSGVFYMYFGAEDPTDYTVKIATQDNLATVLRKYITFCNIHFTGCNSVAIDINTYGGTNVIKNCTIDFVGGDGIQISQDSGDQTTTFSITDNILSDINVTGINWLSSTLNHGTISGNIINNIGLLRGGGPLTYPCSDFWADGINVFAHDVIVELNRLTNIGHIGIRFSESDNVIVRKNVIDGVGLTRYDAGGIYVWNSGGFYTGYNYSTQVESKIEDNIILNGYAVNDGAAPLSELGVWGIYMDEYSIDLDVTRNTVYNFPTSGIFFLCPVKDIRTTYNTTFNNGVGFSAFAWTGKPITLNAVNNNKFIAKETTQKAGQFQDASNNFSTFGTFDYNYYTRPIDDDDDIRTIIWTTGTNRTLAGWVTYASQDSHSNKSLGGTVSTTDDLHFIYNDTTVNMTYTLSDPMKDVANADYSGSIYIAPFSSLVLIGEGTVTEGYPEDPEEVGYPTVSTTSIAKYSTYMVTLGGDITSDGGGTITSSGVVWSASANPTLSDNVIQAYKLTEGSYSIILRNPLSTIHIRAFAINETGTSYGEDITFIKPSYSVGKTSGKVGYYNGKIGVVK